VVSLGDTTLADIVKDYIKIRYKKPGDVFLGVIHRLDRPVSGAIIFARTSKGLSRMNEVFRNKAIKKTYLAICEKRPENFEGTLSNFIYKDQKKNKAFIHQSAKRGAKKAILNYRLLAEVSGRALLEVDLETGRPHQIRAQLAHMGCPIVNDIKYGAAKFGTKGIIYLHCSSMEFIHPVKKEPIKFTAEIPDDQIWEPFS
ncbi:MAG: RNA pseudouridine synthase, partial [Bacteroidota bacterium]